MPSVINPETPARYIGWRRHRGGRWQAVAEADTYDECWQKLAEVRAADAIGGDSMILPANENPNEKRTAQ